MKNLIIILFLGFVGSTYGQIRSVRIQASGLTCSMCNRAIYESLKKIPEVIKVQEDIEHSSYLIHFSDPGKVSLEKLKKAVKDAGFSVAWMKVNAGFNHVVIASDSSLKINDLLFIFVETPSQSLNGEKSLLVVDKDYLLEKDRKKYIGTFRTKPDSEEGKSLFHVTLPNS
jgi:copper chaperone CopZ